MRILFASPPHPESDWLCKALRESAHSLQRTRTLESAADEAARERFDAIVLVVSDPARCSEIEAVLERVCAVARGAIVMALLPAANAQDRVKMLRAGADACFARPFSFLEVHERLQALRRMSATQFAPVSEQFDMSEALRLDSVTRELVNGEQRLPLTKREYLFCECLMREVDAPVAHDQLIRYTWPEKSAFDFSSVSPLVWRLRSKLKKSLPSVHISTVNGFGYQLRFA
ncbi:response regulator transcription factor [Paraburkholderia sp. J12]|uniref:response regulator transcription factor n=1 Tax=Paraburkholderia sp. J12 TaxID=2805432 RepID=UPI002ABE7B63|nr:response regulator transcription factor [Paraburkholderia sp. J12]